MRLPVEWLKEHVAVRLAPDRLAHRLTMAGLEVTGIEQAEGGPVLVLEITPNRADCLSIIGIAREVAALTGQPLKLPSVQSSKFKVQSPPRTSDFELRTKLVIRIEDRKGCRRYIGRLISGVTIAPSPEWMQRRLAACGIRPINNVVDITNYVLLEYGQPLHAFDFDRLAQGTVIVRRATPKEPLTTLDGIARTLGADTLVIADANRAVAVAGVMGGVGSEATPNTTRIVLESAEFDPLTVRRTARALGLSSESSYRFERGVDPVGVERASARAASLICQLAGGTQHDSRDVGAKPIGKTAIIVDAGKASRWLGVRLAPSHIRSLLARLGCRVSSSEASPLLRVVPPSFRRDLVGDVDCFEEVARLVGYEHLPGTLPTAVIPAARDDRDVESQRVQSLRCLSASLGCVEAINWSLVSEAELSRCGWSADRALRLANPLNQDYAFLRPSLIMGLLRAVRRNVAQGAEGVRLFELGAVHQAGGAPAERASLGLALTGVWSRDWRSQSPCDFFQLKGLVETLIQRFASGQPTCRSESLAWAESGTSARVLLNQQPVGTLGRVARRVASAWDLETDVWFAELDVAALLNGCRALERMAPLPQLPPVKRDLSLLVGQAVTFEQVAETIHEVGGTLAHRVELIDRYTGKQLPEKTYSLTFSIDYRDPLRTLTSQDVEQVHHRIGRALVERLGALLR